VDRGFAIIFDRELGPVWILIYHRGNLLKVFYNMDLRYPMIINDWDELRKLYALEGFHDILFRYVGEDNFHITVFKRPLYDDTVIKFFRNIEGRNPLTFNFVVHFIVTLSTSIFKRTS